MRSKILLLLALLSVIKSHGQVAGGAIQVGGAAIVTSTAGTGGSSTSASQTIVNNFINSSGITNQNVAAALARFSVKVSTMANYANFRYQWFFGSQFNPSNHIDFFGNTNINWTKEPTYGAWGAQFNLTNSGSFSVNSSTNWCVLVVKRNYSADNNDTAVSFPTKMEIGVENSNGNGYYLSFTPGNIVNYNFSANYNGIFPYASNWNLASTIFQTGAKANDGPVAALPPALWVFNTSNSRFVSGYFDTMPLYLANGQTNMAFSVTNLSAPNRISMGGSTNFLANNTGWSGANVSTTNGQFELFSVAFFDTNLSQTDINTYYSAIAELRPKTRWVFTGDSMIQERVGGIVPFANVYSNCIPWHFMLRHPSDEWSDYAQGGATINTFSNQIPPRVVTLWPSDTEQIMIHDFPRNNIAVTNKTGVDYNAIAVSLIQTLRPYTTYGVTIWQYESVLPATNTYFDITGAGCTNTMIRSNLLTGYRACWTNGTANRYIHGLSLWSGAVWDGNTSMFYQSNSGYASGNNTTGGFHIEGTNAPIFFNYTATLIDTGEWPPTMPNPPIFQ